MIPYDNLSKVNEPYTLLFEKRFSQFLDKGRYILGDEVKKFQEDFASYNQMNYCVGVANGLDALILAIWALHLPKGSEIIVPSNTYIASIFSIIHTGHKPVLVEPDIIEDCAQAHGAKYKGRMAGTFGIMSGFSFYPSKNLGALGDGGAVLMNSPKLCEELKMIRNYGSNGKYYNEVVGYNSRLDEIQAIFLGIKLPYLDKVNNHKRKLAPMYLEQLKEDFILPVVHSDYHDVYHIFNVRHPKRAELKDYLQKLGIGTEIHYPVPPNKQKAMANLLGHLEFPIAESIHETILSLPCSACHTELAIQQVIDALNAF